MFYTATFTSYIGRVCESEIGQYVSPDCRVLLHVDLLVGQPSQDTLHHVRPPKLCT